MKLPTILSLALALCAGMANAAEPGDWTAISVSEPGELYFKCLEASGGDLSTITRLKVSGTAESQDLQISPFTNLVEVDFTNLDVTDKKLPNEFAKNLRDLQRVTLRSDIESIGNEAFYKCQNLESVRYTVSPQQLSIGKEAFYECYKLAELNVVNVDKVGKLAFYSCGFDASGFRGIKEVDEMSFTQSKITEIPDGFFSAEIKVIPKRCFESSALKKVNIPASITEIADLAFNYCYSLTEVNFSESLRNIGTYAFNCARFENLELPASLISISEKAFCDCPYLKSITCLMPVPPSSDVFAYTRAENVTAHVPNSLIDVYAAAPWWRDCKEIVGQKGSISLISATSPLSLLITDNFTDDCADELSVNVGYTQLSYNNFNVGQLTLDGTGALSIKSFDIATPGSWRGTTYDSPIYPPSFINSLRDVTLDAITLTIDERYPRHWILFSFPFDVAYDEIEIPDNCDFVVRRYDGEARSKLNMANVWTNVLPGDTIYASQIYAYMISPGDFDEFYRIKIRAIDNDNQSKFLECYDTVLQLESYPSEMNIHDSWNGFGNPYPAYYSIADITTADGGTLVSPIIMRTADKYTAYSPIDDDVCLLPFDAFFIQKSGVTQDLKFHANSRLHTNQAKSINSAKRSPGIVGSDRDVFNFHLTSGNISSRARIVVNEEADLGYEAGLDAPKWADQSEASSHIYVNADVNYEICERPLADGFSALGISIAESDTYAISLSGRHDAAWHVWLTDCLTGATVDLTATDYEFEAEAGTDQSRFTVYLDDSEVSTIKSIDTDADDMGVVVNATGAIVYRGRISDFQAPATGIYVVSQGSKARKIFSTK